MDTHNNLGTAGLGPVGGCVGRDMGVVSEKLCHCRRPFKVLVWKKKTRVRNAKGDLVSNRHCLFLEIWQAWGVWIARAKVQTKPSQTRIQTTSSFLVFRPYSSIWKNVQIHYVIKSCVIYSQAQPKPRGWVLLRRSGVHGVSSATL